MFFITFCWHSHSIHQTFYLCSNYFWVWKGSLMMSDFKKKELHQQKLYVFVLLRLGRSTSNEIVIEIGLWFDSTVDDPSLRLFGYFRLGLERWSIRCLEDWISSCWISQLERGYSWQLVPKLRTDKGPRKFDCSNLIYSIYKSPIIVHQSQRCLLKNVMAILTSVLFCL